MTVVLMDTKRHKTVDMKYLGSQIEQPVDIRWMNEYMFTAVATFTYAGMLYGDPVYYQTKGPALPASWWDR